MNRNRRAIRAGGHSVSDPANDIKQRDRQIARNESEMQASGDVRVTTWAVALAVVIGFAVFGWLLFR
jgi:hypothetical protein